jgi:hypothetical protein
MLGHSEALAMLLQTFDTEEFLADGSSVSQGEAVGRRPKVRKIDGIKLAFLPRLRGF